MMEAARQVAAEAGPAAPAAGRRTLRMRLSARLKVVVAIACLFVLLVGGTALAAGGVLPAPIQNAVSHAAGAIGIHMPRAHHVNYATPTTTSLAPVEAVDTAGSTTSEGHASETSGDRTTTGRVSSTTAETTNQTATAGAATSTTVSPTTVSTGTSGQAAAPGQNKPPVVTKPGKTKNGNSGNGGQGDKQGKPHRGWQWPPKGALQGYDRSPNAKGSR